MWFNSLLFSYWLLRRRNDRHVIHIQLPRTWFWKPVAYHAIALDENYVVRWDNTEKIEKKEKLNFLIPDGYTMNIILYYSGWFNALKTKELTIKIPIRIRPVSDLRVEVIELKDKQYL